jgi:hypothetical protein
MVNCVCAGSYATQPRQPRQVRKEATVTGSYGRSRSPGALLPPPWNATVSSETALQSPWSLAFLVTIRLGRNRVDNLCADLRRQSSPKTECRAGQIHRSVTVGHVKERLFRGQSRQWLGDTRARLGENGSPVDEQPFICISFLL